MAVTAEEVVERVKASNAASVARATKALATAEELLAAALADAYRPMPEATRDECVLSVAFAVYDRAKGSDGTRGATTMEGAQPVRAPRDPLASVRTILANYVLGCS